VQIDGVAVCSTGPFEEWTTCYCSSVVALFINQEMMAEDADFECIEAAGNGLH